MCRTCVNVCTCFHTPVCTVCLLQFYTLHARAYVLQYLQSKLVDTEALLVCTLHSVLCTGTMFYVLYSVLCTVQCFVYCTVFCVLYSVLCTGTVFCVLVQCFVYWYVFHVLLSIFHTLLLCNVLSTLPLLLISQYMTSRLSCYRAYDSILPVHRLCVWSLHVPTAESPQSSSRLR